MPLLVVNHRRVASKREGEPTGYHILSALSASSAQRSGSETCKNCASIIMVLRLLQKAATQAPCKNASRHFSVEYGTLHDARWKEAS